MGWIASACKCLLPVKRGRRPREDKYADEDVANTDDDELCTTPIISTAQAPERVDFGLGDNAREAPKEQEQRPQPAIKQQAAEAKSPSSPRNCQGTVSTEPAAPAREAPALAPADHATTSPAPCVLGAATGAGRPKQEESLQPSSSVPASEELHRGDRVFSSAEVEVVAKTTPKAPASDCQSPSSTQQQANSCSASTTATHSDFPCPSEDTAAPAGAAHTANIVDTTGVTDAAAMHTAVRSAVAESVAHTPPMEMHAPTTATTKAVHLSEVGPPAVNVAQMPEATPADEAVLHPAVQSGSADCVGHPRADDVALDSVTQPLETQCRRDDAAEASRNREDAVNATVFASEGFVAAAGLAPATAERPVAEAASPPAESRAVGQPTQRIGSAKVLGYKCPQCGENLASFMEAVSHCGRPAPRVPLQGASPPAAFVPRLQDEHVATPPPSKQAGGSVSVSAGASVETQAPSSVSKSASDAGDHSSWRSGPEDIPEASASFNAAPTSGQYAPSPPQPPPRSFPQHAEPPQDGPRQMMEYIIARDENGQVLITRQVDVSTGVAQTIVHHGDGTVSAFGDQTIDSLIASLSDHSASFVTDLTDNELRGLVHETGQRLMANSQAYHGAKTEEDAQNIEEFKEFFGLAEDATERDLENAYRQLARKLHPDKNGGTEEAKEQFQELQAKYDTLKANGLEGKSGEAAQTKSESISYDPTNRASMEETLWKMVDQLRVLLNAMKARQAGD
eukprot:TRINITY_DN29582_c0_g1_i1.p1 TRINITY_DN29582_c0_g1~~TRINITY_DN29582_c0_g1_i1.p1  ORF type:complete len:753 (-),score=117.64 TRINITY_DN29582_c0_g1_i1:353-2566(-)